MVFMSFHNIDCYANAQMKTLLEKTYKDNIRNCGLE